jgi:hypothetical protein
MLDPNYQSAAAAYTYRTSRVAEQLSPRTSHALNLALSFLCGGAAGSLSKSMIVSKTWRCRNIAAAVAGIM